MKRWRRRMTKEELHLHFTPSCVIGKLAPLKMKWNEIKEKKVSNISRGSVLQEKKRKKKTILLLLPSFTESLCVAHFFLFSLFRSLFDSLFSPICHTRRQWLVARVQSRRLVLVPYPKPIHYCYYGLGSLGSLLIHMPNGMFFSSRDTRYNQRKRRGKEWERRRRRRRRRNRRLGAYITAHLEPNRRERRSPRQDRHNQ